MHPEPGEASQKFSSPQSSQENTQDSQYGSHNSDEQLSRQLHAGQGEAKPRRSASITSSSASSAASSDDPRERSLRRLSRPSRQKSESPVDRIIEHEKHLTYVPKKRIEGRTFTVVQRGKILSSAIEDFPNGSTPYLRRSAPKVLHMLGR